MNARKYLDAYLAKNKDNLTPSDSFQYKEVLCYALKDFISKDRSAFYSTSVDETLADDYVPSDYYDDMVSAMNKILANQPHLYDTAEIDKIAIFNWTLQIYRHLGSRKINALRTLNRAKALTGSKLQQMEIENLMRRVKRIDYDAVVHEASPITNIHAKIKNRMKKMRIDNMRALEEDFYEMNMRIRNVEDEDDALYLMRQINTRISLIEDFVNSEDLTSAEARRWNDSLDNFKRIREELANTMVYRNSNYGIFVKYPEIKEDNY